MCLVDQTPTEDAGKTVLVLVELVLRELLFFAVPRLIFIGTVSLGRRYISWARWSMSLGAVTQTSTGHL